MQHKARGSSYEAISECLTEMLAEYRDEPVTRQRNNLFSEVTMNNQQKIMINKEDMTKKLDGDHFK